MSSLKCRFCGHTLRYTFVNLGVSPLANSYLKSPDLQRAEKFYPLHVFVCEHCFLVQLPVIESPERLFGDYAYFSSYSDSWLNHVREYSRQMIKSFGFNSNSQVIEIASNDGYLLQYFQKEGIPVLGIEPAGNVAKAAQNLGIPTVVKFFNVQTATELVAEDRYADLLIGNNVLAHVPDLNDFVSSLKIVLKPQGIITMEFPHLLQMMTQNQFDTIYHEHFSYFSCITVNNIFAHHGLTIFDVEELKTHGGSLRIYACHAEDTSKPISQNIENLISVEEKSGLDQVETYLSFGEKVKETKRHILEFFIHAKRENKTIAAYGAPAKGNTLLNYCGIRTDFIEFTVDLSPHKQGDFLPGTHIPIYHPDKVNEAKPDYVVILPWNLRDEIMEQMSGIRDWGGCFVTLIPKVKIFNDFC